MTSRDDLRTCGTSDRLSDIKRTNEESRYIYIPVIEGGRFLGLLNVERWFTTEPPDELADQHFDHLSEDSLIGADASILDFVQTADEHPCRLVVSGHRIEGIVSLSDLQKLPVRAALFALITDFELVMIEAIRARYGMTSIWQEALSDDRRQMLREIIEQSRLAEGHVDDLLFTQFCDKATIVRKSMDLVIPTSKLKASMKSLERFRNKLAYANDYAATPEHAREVAKLVRSLLDLRQRLIASKL